MICYYLNVQFQDQRIDRSINKLLISDAANFQMELNLLVHFCNLFEQDSVYENNKSETYK